MARRRQPTRRDYPRVARVNELVREIVADELERLEDPRLERVAVTGVEVTADIEHAVVFVDNLDGPDGDAAVLEALDERRPRLQAAIARQARLRRTPELRFRPDPAVRAGQRIEEILRDLDAPGADTDDADTGDADTDTGDADTGDADTGDADTDDGDTDDGRG